MKRLLLAIAVCALLGAVSCQLAEPVGSGIDQKQITITATLEEGGAIAVDGEVAVPETKTTRLADGSVWWTPGDEISVFYGSGADGGSKFTSTNTEATDVAQFTGSIGVITGAGESGAEATTFWGVYPYDPSIVCYGTSVRMPLPAKQVSAEGTFAKGQWPTIGRAQALAMSFWNIACGYKFKVQTEGIEKVTFTSGGSEWPLAGTIDVGIDSKTKRPAILQTTNGSTTVEVTPEDGGTFKPGVYYYAVMEPGSVSHGMTMTFYKGLEQASYECVMTGDKPEHPSARGKFKIMDNKDAGLTWSVRQDYAYLPGGDAIRDALALEGVSYNSEVDRYFFNRLIFQTGVDPAETRGTLMSTSGAPIYVSSGDDAVFIYTSASSFLAPQNSSYLLANLNVPSFEGLESIDFSKAENLSFLFYNDTATKELDLSWMDTSSALDMTGMFGRCWDLESVDLTSFDTSNVVSMSGMFLGCRTLESVDLTSFDTSNVTNMGAMFYDCWALESLDLTRFDTSKVLDMSHMFYSCTHLDNVDFSNFNTSAVVDMSAMFYDCQRFAHIDLTSFDTSSLTSAAGMFYNNVWTHVLDLSSFDTSKVTDFNQFLRFCDGMEELILGDRFIISGKTDLMFDGMGYDDEDRDGIWTKIHCNDAQMEKLYTVIPASDLPVYRFIGPNRLHGEFSVSPTRKVNFSKGNLLWDGKAFKMYDNQYEASSKWNPLQVDCFYWTSKPFNAYAQEFSESETDATSFFAADGGAIAGWTALTIDEWNYLLSIGEEPGRGAGDTYVKPEVTVCGVGNCLVIAPDGNTKPIADSYDATAWAAAQLDGFVCLPPIRNRVGNQYAYDPLCCYWTSTPYIGHANSSYYIAVNSDGILLSSWCGKNWGYSVRLVSDAL